MAFGVLILKERLRVTDRILNISQPHVCPIVRGKAGAKADSIYKRRDNRVRPWGGRKSGIDENSAEILAYKKLLRQNEIDRIAIEGKFGQGERRFRLSRIMAKLAQTSESMIMLSFMVRHSSALKPVLQPHTEETGMDPAIDWRDRRESSPKNFGAGFEGFSA